MTLHEAIQLVLLQNGTLTIQQLTDILNKEGLFQRGDGNEIPYNQVSARISHHNYRHLFNREAGIISLAA